MTRTTTLAILLSLSMPHTALAQQGNGPDLMVADCAAGGCTCRLLDLSEEDVAFLLGAPLPPGAMQQTLVRANGALSFTPQDADAVHRAAGGTGDCVIEVFQITPLDGTWTGSVRVQNISGCLPQVASTVPPMVDGTNASKRIAWGGVFHPSQFVVGSSTSDFEWTQVSPTHFDGRFPVPANGVLDVSVTGTATLTAPDRAEATVALRLAAANGADAGALAMLGMADCRVDAAYDFVRTGD